MAKTVKNTLSKRMICPLRLENNTLIVFNYRAKIHLVLVKKKKNLKSFFFPASPVVAQRDQTEVAWSLACLHAHSATGERRYTIAEWLQHSVCSCSNYMHCKRQGNFNCIALFKHRVNWIVLHKQSRRMLKMWLNMPGFSQPHYLFW